MGGTPYFYTVPFEKDYHNALQKLREKEFEAGRYNPVIDFPADDITLSPGKQHATIQDALEDSIESGTRSILDIFSVSDEEDYSVARILDKDDLIEYFGTAQPTIDAIRKNSFYEDIGRGQAVCFPIYKEGEAVQLHFCGYSYD